MSLEDIIDAVAQLNAEQRQELRQYLNHVPEKTSRLTSRRKESIFEDRDISICMV